MANYYSIGRTNYFAVKNLDLFKEEIDKISNMSIPVEVCEKTKDGKNLVGLLFPEGTYNSYYDDDTDDDITFDVAVWTQIIKEHLEDDWVCVIQEIGWEKLRYLTGYAIAFNNTGVIDRTDLDEIYEAGEHLGKYCTQATY
jgi:hypothetical protein